MYLDIRVTIITALSVTKLIALCLHGFEQRVVRSWDHEVNEDNKNKI